MCVGVCLCGCVESFTCTDHKNTNHEHRQLDKSKIARQEQDCRDKYPCKCKHPLYHRDVAVSISNGFITCLGMRMVMVKALRAGGGEG